MKHTATSHETRHVQVIPLRILLQVQYALSAIGTCCLLEGIKLGRYGMDVVHDHHFTAGSGLEPPHDGHSHAPRLGLGLSLLPRLGLRLGLGPGARMFHAGRGPASILEDNGEGVSDEQDMKMPVRLNLPWLCVSTRTKWIDVQS